MDMLKKKAGGFSKNSREVGNKPISIPIVINTNNSEGSSIYLVMTREK